MLYYASTDNLWYGDDTNDIAVGVEACYFSDKERIGSVWIFERYVGSR